MAEFMEAVRDWSVRGDLLAPEVSGWSVHRQVDHIVKTASKVLEIVEGLLAGGGEPGEPTELGQRILRDGAIPRGVAESPDFVVPAGSPDMDAVRQGLADATTRIEALGPLPEETNRIPHPALGPIDARDWMRFLEVHTNHHLAILADIGKAAG